MKLFLFFECIQLSNHQHTNTLANNEFLSENLNEYYRCLIY